MSALERFTGRLLVGCLLQAGCGGEPSDKPSAPSPSTEQTIADSTGEPKAAATEEPAAAAAPVDVDDGNTVIHAKARDDTTTLNLKAPDGWRIVTPPTEPDPVKGKFRLHDALAGLPRRSAGTLVATLETSKGKIYCDLFERKSPGPVTQFVGLARGLRPVWNGGKSAWEKRKYYDGTIFHRVIPGFMAQGGDPAANGSGLLGYTFDTGASRSKIKHDRPGQLCMAAGRDISNHAQFFITESASRQLDGQFAVFGQCSPVQTVYRITRVTNSGTPHFRPLKAVALERVEITRYKGGARALSAIIQASDSSSLPSNELPGVVPPGRAIADPEKLKK